MTFNEALQRLKDDRILESNMIEALEIPFDMFIKIALSNRYSRSINNLITRLENETK